VRGQSVKNGSKKNKNLLKQHITNARETLAEREGGTVRVCVLVDRGGGDKDDVAELFE